MFLDANASPSLCISIVIRGIGIEMVKLYQVRNLLSNHIGKAIQIEIKEFPEWRDSSIGEIGFAGRRNFMCGEEMGRGVDSISDGGQRTGQCRIR